MKTEEIDLTTLHAECIDMKPVNCDWEALSGFDGEGYTAYEAVEGDISGRVYVARAPEGDEEAQSLSDYEDPDEDLDSEECQEWLERFQLDPKRQIDDHEELCEALREEHVGLAEGPMMSYYYPLPDVERYGFDPEQAAYALRDLPLCVVEFSNESQDKGAPAYALALTGGGMDLSWEICEAFMQIGQLPPIHFCELPAMADRANPDSQYGNFKRDSAIIAACRRSIEVKQQRLGFALETLDRLTPVTA